MLTDGASAGVAALALNAARALDIYGGAKIHYAFLRNAGMGGLDSACPCGLQSVMPHPHGLHGGITANYGLCHPNRRTNHGTALRANQGAKSASIFLTACRKFAEIYTMKKEPNKRAFVLRYAREHSSFSIDELLEAVSVRMGTSRSGLRWVLHKVAKDGYLERVRRGVYKRRTRSCRLFPCCARMCGNCAESY